MLLDERTMTALHEIAQMRGIHLYRHHCEAVSRLLARRKTMPLDEVFDVIRNAGCRMTFEQEHGLRQWLTDIDQTRRHRSNLDIERTRRSLDRPVPHTYRGDELRELLRHDTDERGKMRGPVISGLRVNREDWVL